jgi:FAD:protein FMN transferase
MASFDPLGRYSMRAFAPIGCLLAAIGHSTAFADAIHLSGDTMGTTYNITVVDPPGDATEASLGTEVATVLAEVNSQLSNWDPESEVSRFNAAISTDPIPVSEAFATVIRTAAKAHELSGGKFDVTLAPLIDLWGFGPRQPGEPVPDDADIEAALTNVGQARMLTLAGDTGTLAKTNPGVTVNLSAIAKGYGIDQLAAALAALGARNYLVEIGGDLVTRGLNPDGNAWAIGIERPDSAGGTIASVVRVSDMGMATSGDYRNYFEDGGVRYSHIIDPTTGRPITHGTASVSVLAPDATTADAMATALLVVGAEEGRAIAEREGLAALFITRAADGFVTTTTAGFDALVATE